MGTAQGKNRTDEQLTVIFDETDDWVVKGRRGSILCHAASLLAALDRAADFGTSGAVVMAICRLPATNIIVFPEQIARLRFGLPGPQPLVQLVRLPDTRGEQRQ
jgi:hypothetical protein